jgi:hypothetical protein
VRNWYIPLGPSAWLPVAAPLAPGRPGPLARWTLGDIGPERVARMGNMREEFTLTGQTRLCRPDRDWKIEGEITENYQRVKAVAARPGEQFCPRHLQPAVFTRRLGGNVVGDGAAFPAWAS